MRNEIFLEESLDCLPGVAAVINAGGASFGELVAVCGLSAARDFRFADLRGIDVSGADLRGYDFTGADLRDVVGVGVRFDRTTILMDADVDGSVFAHTVTQNHFFAQNEHWAKQYSRLKNADWTAVSIWLGEQIGDDEQRTAGATRVALRLYETSDQSSVRSSIMFFVPHAFRTREEYRDFLMYALSTEANANILRTAIDILVRLFPKSLPTLSYCKRFLYHDDANIRRIAFVGILNSGALADSVIDELRSFMAKETSRWLRRELLRVMARRRGPHYVDLCIEQYGSPLVFRDYQKWISDDEIRSIATSQLREERQRLISGLRMAHKADFVPPVSTARVDERMWKLRGMLADLSRDGVPFRVQELYPTDKSNTPSGSP